MQRLLPPIGLMVLSVLLIGWSVFSQLPKDQRLDTSGHDDPVTDGLIENGWVVANYGDARVLDSFTRYRGQLGEPVSGFDGTCQMFRMGRLCYAPGNPPEWKIEWANLGDLDMQVEGYTPNPGRTPHSALRDWLVAQREAGLDTTRVVGRIISDAVCDRRSGRCVQWTDKQRFEFDVTASTADAVQRQPLGLWTAYPSARPLSTGRSSGIDPGPLALAAIPAAVGLLLMARAGGATSHGRSLPI